MRVKGCGLSPVTVVKFMSDPVDRSTPGPRSSTHFWSGANSLSNHLTLCCPPFCLQLFPASGSFLKSSSLSWGSQMWFHWRRKWQPNPVSCQENPIDVSFSIYIANFTSSVHDVKNYNTKTFIGIMYKQKH